MKILVIAYVVAGLYSLGLLWTLLKGLKKHNLSDTYDELYSKKYAIFIVVVALIATPIHFWISLSHTIPEKSYIVDVTVKCRNGIEFNAKGTVMFSEDVEYYDSGRDGEPLFGLSNGDKTVVNSHFYLTDVDCNSKYKVSDYSDEPIDGNKVRAIVCYYDPYDEVDTEVDAEIILPELTDKTLGITLSDKFAARSISSHIEHGLIFVAALLDIILCFMAISCRKGTPETH